MRRSRYRIFIPEEDSRGCFVQGWSDPKGAYQQKVGCTTKEGDIPADWYLVTWSRQGVQSWMSWWRNHLVNRCQSEIHVKAFDIYQGFWWILNYFVIIPFGRASVYGCLEVSEMLSLEVSLKMSFRLSSEVSLGWNVKSHFKDKGSLRSWLVS